MIEIDGSNAGGQVVRTAVALSALTETPVRITNIRASRPQPGLMTQHMEGIRTIGELCGADINGLELGSQKLQFFPNRLEPKNLRVELSTAGSVGLVLQALLIPASQLPRPITIDVFGGSTWGKWAPPLQYMQRVLFPLIGDSTEVTIRKEGFYPKGGAIVEVESVPFRPRDLMLIDAGNIDSIRCISVASESLKKANVAERQAKGTEQFLEAKMGMRPDVEVRYSDAKSSGSGLLLYATTPKTIMGADAVGEPGITAEQIGEAVAKALFMDTAEGAVDRHAADMLLPYMAIRGSGKIYVSQITKHVLANIAVIQKFLPVKFRVDGKEGGPGSITI